MSGEIDTANGQETSGTEQPSKPVQREALDPESIIGYNSKGYPIRTGKKDCIFYFKNGFCGFKVQCPYSHPERRPASTLSSTRPTPSQVPKGQELSTTRSALPGHSGLSEEEIRHACFAVNRWLAKKGGEIPLSRIFEFLSEHPEFKRQLEHKPKVILMKHPELIVFRGPKVGHQFIRTPEFASLHPVLDAVQENKSSERESLDEPAPEEREEPVKAPSAPAIIKESLTKSKPQEPSSAREAAEALAEFMMKNIGGELAGKQLGMFYKLHPEHRLHIGKGTWQLLPEVFPDIFLVASPAGVSPIIVGIQPSYKQRLAQPPSANHTIEKSVKERIDTTPPVASSLKKPNAEGLVDPAFKTAAMTLSEYLKTQPDCVIFGNAMGSFFTKYPQFKSILKGKLKELAQSFPSLFRVRGASYSLTLVHAGSSLWNAPEEKIKATPAPVEQTSKVTPRENHEDEEPRFVKKKVFAYRPEVVLETLQAWVPFDEIAVDVEVIPGTTKLCAIKLCGPNNKMMQFHMKSDVANMLAKSGLRDVFEDKDVIKICHTSSTVASALFSAGSIVVRNVFDLRAAGAVLDPIKKAEEMSLFALADKYKILHTNDFKELTSMPDWSRITPLLNRWLGATIPHYIALYKAMSAQAVSKNLMNACFHASEQEIMRGIRFARLFGVSLAEKEDSGASSRVRPKFVKKPKTYKPRTTKPVYSYSGDVSQIPCKYFYHRTPGRCPFPSCRFMH